MRPIDTHRTYSVPCGRCAPCKKRRVQEWTFRLIHEERKAASCYFVTLTYDTTTVPMTKNGFMTLSKTKRYRKPRKVRTRKDGKATIIKWKDQDDLTLFFKRLRKLEASQGNTEKLKYYAAGEYGESRTYGRPHYHIILFNLKYIQNLGKAWQKGKIDIQTEPKAGSFAYTAKYIDKEKKIPLHKNDDRRKEYSVMSNKLGANYLTPQAIRWHRSNFTQNAFVSTRDGVKLPMPRYYKDQIFTQEQRTILADLAQAKLEEKERELLKTINIPIFEHYQLQKQSREAKFNNNPKKRDVWQNQ